MVRLLVRLWLIRILRFGLRKHAQLTHDPKQTFRAARVATLAKSVPELNHTKVWAPVAHIPDELEFCLCMLVGVTVRPSGLAKDATLPSQRAFQKQMYDRLLLYFRLARLTPYFAAYCIRSCRYRMTCVILLFMKNGAAFGGSVLCGNSTIPLEGPVLLLFILFFRLPVQDVL